MEKWNVKLDVTREIDGEDVTSESCLERERWDEG